MTSTPMCGTAAFVYHGRQNRTHAPSECWRHVTSVQQWLYRYSSTIASFFIHHVHSMPPLNLTVLSRLDRGIQSATEMLPLTRGRGCWT